MRNVSCPKGTWLGQGWRQLGDCAAHKEPDCVTDFALWENKYHKVILFWTIWCPRESKPKKTWAKEREPAMPKSAGEARVRDRRSYGFPSWKLATDAQSSLLVLGPLGSRQRTGLGAREIIPQTDGSRRSEQLRAPC